MIPPADLRMYPGHGVDEALTRGIMESRIRVGAWMPYGPSGWVLSPVNTMELYFLHFQPGIFQLCYDDRPNVINLMGFWWLNPVEVTAAVVGWLDAVQVQVLLPADRGEKHQEEPNLFPPDFAAVLLEEPYLLPVRSLWISPSTPCPRIVTPDRQSITQEAVENMRRDRIRAYWKDHPRLSRDDVTRTLASVFHKSCSTIEPLTYGLEPPGWNGKPGRPKRAGAS